MNKDSNFRKTHVRSVMSDQELAALIRHDREERPQEFQEATASGGSAVARFHRVPAVAEVIAKWL